jgi:hypothetical protein
MGAYVLLVADGTEGHQKELQELRVAAQIVVESIGLSEESGGSLVDHCGGSLRSSWLKLLEIV